MNERYPYLKVILGFALFGGVLGGLLVVVAVALLFRLPLDSWADMRYFMTVFLREGLIFGTAPALMTGAWLAWRRAPRTQQGMMHAAIAGLAFSVLTAIVAIFYHRQGSPEDLGFFFLAMMLAGVVSATFLASWLLPKPAAVETHE